MIPLKYILKLKQINKGFSFFYYQTKKRRKKRIIFPKK